MDGQWIEERLTYINNDWGGEPLSDEDTTVLLGLLPVLAQVFGEAAPQHFPDGSETRAQEIVAGLGEAAERTLASAKKSGDYETPWRLFFLMRYVRQPDNVPLSSGWVGMVSDSRKVLSREGDEEGLAALEAAANLNRTWWQQNGQWSRFEAAMIAASTPEAVNEVVIMPGEVESSPGLGQTSTSLTGPIPMPVDPLSSQDTQSAIRTARVALALAIAALILGPVAGFFTAKALEVPGPRGPQGAQGEQGPMGPQGYQGEGAEEALIRIDDLAACLNDYMDTVGRAAGGTYRYFYC